MCNYTCLVEWNNIKNKEFIKFGTFNPVQWNFSSRIWGQRLKKKKKKIDGNYQQEESYLQDFKKA